MTNKLNIINVTHNDLDGVFCGVLTNLAYPLRDFNTSIYYCNYDNINEKIVELIDDVIPKLIGNTIVYITDISVNPIVAELIEAIHHEEQEDEHQVSFCLLDHHGNDQVLALNKYSWANVQPFMTFSKKRKTSGTRLYFDYLKEGLSIYMISTRINKLEQYVELVRKYDTWEWKETDDQEPVKFNTLLHIYPRKMFVELFSNKERYSDCQMFSVSEETMLALDESKKKSYIKGKLIESKYMTIGGKCAAVVMAEQYISELGNHMCLQFDKADFAVIFTGKSLSFRSTNGTDVAKIAQMFGGNGHPPAAGASVSEDIRMDLFSDLIYMLQAGLHIVDLENEE